MSSKVGIVGLPNVGKSTLFSAITAIQTEIANYPFVTIDANIGIAKVYDERLSFLGEVFSSRKVIEANLRIVDIAGLIKGASKGEGLGNQFLGNIRNVDMICHVVRCFEDKSIIHVHDKIDPIDDLESVNLELIYADLEQAVSTLKKISKNSNHDKALTVKKQLLEDVIDNLNRNKMLNEVSFSPDETEILKEWNFLTIKHMLYVANLEEDKILNPLDNKHYKKLIEKVGTEVITISAKLELEISKLAKEERQEFIDELGLKMSGLDKIVRKCYETLHQKTFFTAGEQETRAWVYVDGMTAQECAGVIHTDFAKGFIKAEIYKYSDLKEWSTIQNLKNKGLIKTEGKKYLMKDGDVCFFKFNI